MVNNPVGGVNYPPMENDAVTWGKGPRIVQVPWYMGPWPFTSAWTLCYDGGPSPAIPTITTSLTPEPLAILDWLVAQSLDVNVQPRWPSNGLLGAGVVMFHVVLTYGNESGLYEPSSGINLLICLDVSPRQCKLCCCLSSYSVKRHSSDIL